MVLVVSPIQHLEIPKGDVSYSDIKKAVRHLHGFKAVYPEPYSSFSGVTR